MNVYYYSVYLKTLKKNFMLVIMATVLLIPTFFIWAGIPLFIIGGLIENLTNNALLVHLCISLSGGLLFSLPFMPINFKAEKKYSQYNRAWCSKVFHVCTNNIHISLFSNF
ncbi:hypothetical protein [Virgibacillus halodenitrificans]|uniref:hypothetical protein n=1 Tax=Virgibacillus halodenitrificans TaxID=1482 RepID=UPI001F442F07|nr:hypothetical protein [Virgibacillus halodenitrificans]